MVVGDEPQIRDVVHATLEAAHYDILEVVDGSDVLPRVASWRPDMVITDLVMP